MGCCERKSPIASPAMGLLNQLLFFRRCSRNNHEGQRLMWLPNQTNSALTRFT